MSDLSNIPEFPVPGGAGQAAAAESGTNPAQDFVTIPADTIFASEEIKQRFISYLVNETAAIKDYMESQKFYQNWNTWRRQRTARPENETKNTPWPGASNVSVPLAATNTNGIVAHLKKAFKLRKPLFSAESNDEPHKKHAVVAGKFISRLAESPFHVNIRKKNNRIFYDTVSLGTQFVDVPWVVEHQYFKRVDANNVAQVVSKTLYDGPDIIPYRLEDVLVSPNYFDIQQAPLVAFARTYTGSELKNLVYSGYFEQPQGDTPLEGAEQTEMDPNREAEKRRLGSEPDFTIEEEKSYLIYKCYTEFDADDSGLSVPLIAFIEPTNEILFRVEYNEIGRKPIGRVPYLDLPEELYALGVGWMDELLQEEIDTLHNMRVNGIHISSLQMYVTRRGSGIGPNETWKPMKNIQVDDTASDFKVVTFPDVSGPTERGEMIVRQLADRFTGASEAQMGLPDSTAKSGTSPTLQMFLSQQGNVILNSLIDNVEQGYGEFGTLLLMQCVANGDRAKQNLLGLVDQADQALLSEIFDMNVEDIPSLFHFRVKLTDVDKTEDAKRQQIMIKQQLFSMYEQALLQDLSVMASSQASPQMKEFAAQMYGSRTKMMEETLTMLGEANAEELLPYVQDTLFMLDMIKQQKAIALAQMEASQGGGSNGNNAGIAAGGPAIGGTAPGGGPNGNSPEQGGSPSGPNGAPGMGGGTGAAPAGLATGSGPAGG